MSSMQATVHRLDTSAPCSRSCRFHGRLKAHHDRLLRIESDPAELLELMELAVTWGELDYSHQPVIPPEHWLDFVQTHRWQDSDQAERILSLATDIAMGSVRVNRAHPVAVQSAPAR